MSQARVFFYGLATIYLVGVVVQFFLAGLGAFGAANYDSHRAVGYVLAVAALVLLVLAVAAKLPRPLAGLALLLVILNVIQIVLVQIDVEEIQALHVVNALAIALVASMLASRSRRYLGAKLAT